MRILAIDPGAAALGWAGDLDGTLRWGTEDFSLRRVDTEGLRWLRFERWLGGILPGTESPGLLVVYEQQTNYGRQHPGAGEVGRILTALLLKFCEERGIAAEAVSPQTIKAFAIPTRPRPKKAEPKRAPLDRGKAAMIAAAKIHLEMEMERANRGVMADAARMRPLTEHEADALWLYWLMKERNG